jgi:GABA permease
MRRYLIVAHQTLGDAHLVDAVRERMAAGPCQFFLLVPVTHPPGHAWTDAEAEATARKALDEATARFREMGAEVAGDIGDANPVYAVDARLRDDPDFDEIVLSTLPPGPSRWLKWDVPTRMAKRFRIPVTHVLAPRVHAG